jgi:hypothetical protein
MAASAARAVIAWKDDAHIDHPKRHAVDAQYTLQAVIAELERRTEVAEMAHQLQVEKLRVEHPDWSGPESVVKDAPAEVQQVPDESQAVEPAPGDAFLSPHDLAAKYGVNADNLRKRLNRWRYHRDAGYIEASNPGPRAPRYLYSETAIRPVIDAMKTGRQTSGEE